MKILVMSDSHAGLSFMRYAVDALSPDAIVHLGDYYDDGQALAEAYPHIPVHQVAGNCDRYRAPVSAREMLVYNVCGVKLYMTHGHLHYVKQSLYSLLKDAAEAGAAAVLYGHTHESLCYREGDMWVVNPGACGSFGGSVALLEVENKKISACRILKQADIAEISAV